MSRAPCTVGYYVHHVGRGHLQRARSLAAHLAATGEGAVTALSSLERPSDWPGQWVDLARDDDGEPVRPTAGGRLHWAPLGHAGLRSRTAAISAWIERARPDVVVVDLSVEVLLLARLHGIPTVGVVLPGHRDDAAHLLGFEVADALVAFWPPRAEGMLRGVPDAVAARVHRLGALSRLPVDDGPPPPAAGGRHALLLLGTGGDAATAAAATRAAERVRGWTWTVLDGTPERWVEDPSAAMRAADVVVTHAGQNAVAEVAAARRPAVVVPQPRPHAEQATAGSVLAGGWPAVVSREWPSDAADLDRAAGLDGRAWAEWCDGRAVERFAAVVTGTAGTSATTGTGERG
ncbi:glycosyl transferase [Nocardioides dongxiaopingii]|uniref:glycosyltransferase n=1 Tax=Nocardioides sp. S-1144 TaxID=2582905 RepID=UPI00110EB2F3|nr:glycosyltransferase [Nocardioides sp. S-1144]QCW51567.1 glycosyl transferase [Nocardioides sp. S-1144]